MEKQTVFRKVYVNDRMPTEYKRYDTNIGNIHFLAFFRQNIDWWLEEIELPSEEDIKSESKSKGDWYDIENFIKGTNYILNKLK